MKIKKISVIGAGSWGTALALLMAENGLNVALWARRKEVADKIKESRENKQYLPNIKLPENIFISNDIGEVVYDSEIIFVSVPSLYFRSVLKSIKPNFSNQIVVSATKGLERITLKRMSEVIEEEIGKNVKIVVLSGPNLVEEVSRKQPTASVMASKDKAAVKIAAECLRTSTLKVYELSDVVGVEICGALKNITALAVGVCDGFKLGDNARACIMTIGLAEMNSLGRVFGVKRSTFYGLAGVGDLIATCTSTHSRNRFFGQKLTEGKKVHEIIKEMSGMIAEGVVTTEAAYKLSKKHSINMPLTEETYKVLYEGKDLRTAIKDLIEII